jgi:S-formylglutathione hydrolase FrmB
MNRRLRSVRILIVAALLAGFGVPQATDAAEARVERFSFQSPALTRFWTKPVTIDANVLLPPSYDRDKNRHYPTIYVVPGFDEPSTIDERPWLKRMATLRTEFIVVSLKSMIDVHGEAIHQAFADSVNDGPWGTALTSEFIPQIDRRFRTIASPHGRFLFGHSSGGWSVLWLQVNYPGTFGGAWALSPDPVDFADFFGPNLTLHPPQNFYRDGAGREYGLDRVDDTDQETIRSSMLRWDWMQRQIDTYDWVFGPRGKDGKPVPLFDHATGRIDGDVAAYWERHYDITHLLERRWSKDGPAIASRLHVYVGDQDTFHLDGAVRLLRDALASRGGHAEIEFVPGADHWQVYQWHGDIIAYAMGEMKTLLSAPTSSPSP